MQAQEVATPGPGVATAQDPATAESCLRSDTDTDAVDGQAALCPVQGAPVQQEVTRMTSLMKSQNSPADMDDMQSSPAAVAEDGL